MRSSDESLRVSALEVQQVRRRTGMPWIECKQFLESKTPEDRSFWLSVFVSQASGYLHDPIEDDPMCCNLIAAVRKEAQMEVERWHQERIAELEKTSPAVAEVMRSGRGLCHRIWWRTKEILRERHGIEWRHPAEMNPWVVFD